MIGGGTAIITKATQ